MTRRPRRNHSPAFKAKAAIAAIKEEKTLAELARQFHVQPNPITQWRSQLLEGATAMFGEGAKADAAPAVAVTVLHAKIGEVTLANGFLGRARQGRTAGERKTKIDGSPEPPLSDQVRALEISRGSVYYLVRPTSDADLVLMRRIDELHLHHTFAGSRMLRVLLNAEGREIGRRHVATLMKKMGVAATYRQPNTPKQAPGHKIYPCLVRNLAVTRPAPTDQMQPVQASMVALVPRRAEASRAIAMAWPTARCLDSRSTPA